MAHYSWAYFSDYVPSVLNPSLCYFYMVHMWWYLNHLCAWKIILFLVGRVFTTNIRLSFHSLFFPLYFKALNVPSTIFCFSWCQLKYQLCRLPVLYWIVFPSSFWNFFYFWFTWLCCDTTVYVFWLSFGPSFWIYELNSFISLENIWP